MATKLVIKPTVNGQGNYKGKVAIKIYLKGSTNATYVVVGNLNAPEFSTWNEKQGKFIAPTTTAIENNAAIRDVQSALEKLLSLGLYDTPKALKAAYTGKAAASVHASVTAPTFAEWLRIYVEQSKGKAQSTNYQLYNTLRNKLLGVDEKQGIRFDAPTLANGTPIAKIPVNEINTECFNAFRNWVLSYLNGKGYKNLCTTFLAAVNNAAECFTSLSFVNINKGNWRKSQTANAQRPTLSAAQRLITVADEMPVLTIEEINRFANCDLSIIAANGNARNAELLEMYRDFALLVYYLGSRPADVLKLHSVINYDSETQRIVYTPHKLRNRNGKTVVVYLNDTTATDTVKAMNFKALEIIAKYANKSKGGYLLPLPINETDWERSNDTITSACYKNWETRRNNTLQHVNAALKKIAKALNLSVEKLTLYTFRRSSITHQLTGGENWGNVAERSGTSVAMIEKHYRNTAKRG